MVGCEGDVITRVDKTNNSGTTFTTDRETVAVTKCEIQEGVMFYPICSMF